jgi:hypothetical protein
LPALVDNLHEMPASGKEVNVQVILPRGPDIAAAQGIAYVVPDLGVVRLLCIFFPLDIVALRSSLLL